MTICKIDEAQIKRTNCQVYIKYFCMNANIISDIQKESIEHQW